jgi:uncharacterized protein
LVRFWDASALVCVLIPDDRADFADRLMQADREVAVWWGTYTECCSAIARRRHADQLTTAQETAAFAALDEFRTVWHEFEPSEEVRKRARRLLNVHPLRAADALQLAAAQVWSAGERAQFVVFDERLADAARREGFHVVTAPA